MSYPPDEQDDLDELRRNLMSVAHALWPDDADLYLLYTDAGSNVCRATLLAYRRLLSDYTLMNQYASQYNPDERLAIREAAEASYRIWQETCVAAEGATPPEGLEPLPGQATSSRTGAGTLELTPADGLPADWPYWVGNKNLPAHPELDDVPTPGAAAAPAPRVTPTTWQAPQ